jgi:hypothetical protein
MESGSGPGGRWFKSIRPDHSIRINDLHHTKIRGAPSRRLGILFSNRLHATNLSRLNSVSYGAKCTLAASPGLGKLSTRSRFLEAKSKLQAQVWHLAW